MNSCGILVVGAGPVGLALALALHAAGRDCRVLDARDADAGSKDARALALSYGSRQFLERLGVWQRLQPTPIRSIHVSHRGHFGRTRIRASDHEPPALGYVQPAGTLNAVLLECARDRGLTLDYGVRVAKVTAGRETADVSVEIGGLAQTIGARLVAHAEGAPGQASDMAQRDYGQHAVVAVVDADPPATDMAYERFTPSGPLALLPLNGRYAVVLSVPETEAQTIAALGEAGFLERLQSQFGERLSFTAAGARAVFPLALRYRRAQVAARELWLGNAAQTLHPVAGQGFNLALRDVWTLVEKLRADQGDDPGAPALLAAYAGSRRVDRGGVIGVTDALVRVFSNDSPPFVAARAGGLLALDLLPPLRGFFARRMMFGARGG